MLSFLCKSPYERPENRTYVAVTYPVLCLGIALSFQVPLRHVRTDSDQVLFRFASTHTWRGIHK